MGCALYGMLGLDCWHGPRCGDCPTGEWAGDDDLDEPVDNEGNDEGEYQ